MNTEDEIEDQGRTKLLAEKLRESAGRDGVYYVLRFPTRWRLYAFAWEDFGDLWHSEVWRRYVIQDLAEVWAQTRRVSAEELRTQLEPWWKGFPRGRIERGGLQEFTVFHGDDLAQTGLTRERVEKAFELINKKVTWSVDPHEKQNPEHQAALRRVLRY
jgi:hypothetical protein